VSTFDDVDFFTDQSLLRDPYPYYESLRAQCPVARIPQPGVVAVTGYDEAVEVYRDNETYSSCNAATGPFPGLPFEPEGDDIGALIEQFRDSFPMHEHMLTFDPPKHGPHRQLLRRLLTPKRLKENEEFMWGLADRQLDGFQASGRCELMSDYAKPFALLVIADLLGVPQEDHDAFRAALAGQAAGAMDSDERFTDNPLEFLESRFITYVEDRRRDPRPDVLTALATATFPDGSTPEVIDVVRVATFLFAAGQDTTARLLTSGMQILAERPELQQLLRDEPARISNFVEETLRVQPPVKSDFRLARTTTTLGGVDIPAGTTVMIMPGAVNRDPARFDEPSQFRVDRENVRDHLAFGRGLHSCPGGPLARIEAQVSIKRLLDRTADIRIAEDQHGPASARHYDYDPTYIIRGLSALHLEFTPVGPATTPQASA
jgi:cytochrome P450